MDKIKPYLAMARKHHFWIVCGLVVIITLTIWSLAAAEMKKQFTERRDKIKGLEEGAKKVSQQVDPPNEKVVQVAQTCNLSLEQQVYAAWNYRHLVQKKKNPWPEELGTQFTMIINSLPEDAEIPREYRETYMNFIKNYFPRLFEIIDLRRTVVKWTLPKGGRGAAKASARVSTPAAAPIGADLINSLLGGPGNANTATPPPGMVVPGGPMPVAEVEVVGKVEWDETDIKRMASRFFWQQTPATIEIRLAQEDLWVYKALLEIVRNTNGGARFKDIPIRRIEALQIGQDAARAFVAAEHRLVAAGALSGGASGMGPGMGPGMDAGMGMGGSAGMGPAMPMEGASGAGGASSGGSADAAQRRVQQLNNFRYVDQNGKPLSADTKPPFAEFKMMPVYMKLVVSQMKIPNLLVECANSTMPVEVCRVAFQPGQAAQVKLGGAGMGSAGMGGMGMGGMEMGGPGMMGSPGMPPGMGGMPPGMGMEAMPGGGAGGGLTNFPSIGGQALSGEYVPIEVFGIIYIFLPPDPTKLGTGAVGDLVRGGTAPGVAPGAPVAAAPGVAAVPAVQAPVAPPATPAGVAPGTSAVPGVAAPVGPGAAVPVAPGAAPVAPAAAGGPAPGATPPATMPPPGGPGMPPGGVPPAGAAPAGAVGAPPMGAPPGATPSGAVPKAATP